jgi:hypothetical protein
MSDKPKISYVSDNAADYVAGLKTAQTLEDLKSFVTAQRFLAPDAFEAVHSPDFNWDEFKRGRKLENKGDYAGDEWAKKYGAVMMPEIIIRVGIVAHQFGAPWGCAYIRMKEEGLIKETKAHAQYVERERSEVSQ